MGKKVKDKTYYLGYDEFYLLASKFGIKSLFSFEDKNSLELSANGVIKCINKLVCSNIIDCGDDALIVTEDYRRLFQSIANAKKCVAIYSLGRQREKICCYISDRLIVTDISAVSPNKIRIHSTDISQFSQLLFSEGLVSHSDSITEDDAVIWESETVDYLIKNGYKLSPCTICALDRVLGVTDIIDSSSGELIYRCCFIEDTCPVSMLMLFKEGHDIFFGTDEILKRISMLME